jgi:hypothetical protein
MVAPTDKSARLTVDLGDRELYRALRFASVDLDRPIRDIVISALREWLERYEDEKAAKGIDEARRDVLEGRDELVPWEEALARIQAAREAREPNSRGG